MDWNSCRKLVHGATRNTWEAAIDGYDEDHVDTEEEGEECIKNTKEVQTAKDLEVRTRLFK